MHIQRPIPTNTPHYTTPHTHTPHFTTPNTHTHTHHYDRDKITDDEDQQVENVFDKLVSITDNSGNLRKGLRQDILESLNSLRNVFAKMKTQLENKSKESEEVMKITEEMDRTRDSQPTRHVAASVDHRQHTYSGESRLVPPSEVRRRKLLSEVVKVEGSKPYRITLKVKVKNQSTKQINNQF
jgi:hypothetical protein